MSRLMAVLVVVSFALATVVAVAEEQGQVFTYGGQADSKAAFDTKVSGVAHVLLGQENARSEMTLDLKVDTGIGLRIVEVGGDKQRRELSVKDLSISVNGEVRAQPEPQPMTYEMTPTGAITEVQQPDAGEPDLLTAGGADPGLLMVLSQCLHFSPDPVRVGDSWETRDKVKMPSGKELDVGAKSTLDGRVGNILQITTVMDTPTAMDVAAFNVSTTGTLHAELKRTFDLDRGMVVACKGPVVIALTGTFGGPGGMPVAVNSGLEMEMKAASAEAAEEQPAT